MPQTHQSLADWARSKLKVAASQPMLTPVLICGNGHPIGCGTWMHYFPGYNRIITARHLFLKERGVASYTAHPVAKTDVVLHIKSPSPIPGIRSNDVVRCEITPSSIPFAGDWEKNDLTDFTRQHVLGTHEQIQIASLLNGKQFTLTHYIRRTDGEEVFAAEKSCEYGPGESGSGYLSTSGKLHVLLAMRQKSSPVTFFSREVKFPHQI